MGSHNAFRITPDGTITEIVDASGDRAGNTLNTPEGVTTDIAGNVYVAGSQSNNLFKIELSTCTALSICGDPTGDRPTPCTAVVTASDARFILTAAVGMQSCQPCVCDVNNTGDITATDALVTLQDAVGQPVALICPPCAVICGDNIVAQNEECDDGNSINRDDCTNQCRIARCGDGVVHSKGSGTEECDDGNTIDDDACNNSCRINNSASTTTTVTTTTNTTGAATTTTFLLPDVVDRNNGIDLRARPRAGRILDVFWQASSSTITAGANLYTLQLFVGGGQQWQDQVSTAESTDSGIPISFGNAPAFFCLRMVATRSGSSTILGSGTSGNDPPCI